MPYELPHRSHLLTAAGHLRLRVQPTRGRATENGDAHQGLPRNSARRDRMQRFVKTPAGYAGCTRAER